MICRSCHRWMPEPFFTVRKAQHGHCIKCLRHQGAMREAQVRSTKVGFLRWKYRPYRYDGKKECTACHRILERTEFSPRGGDYVMSECRRCHRVRASLARAR